MLFGFYSIFHLPKHRLASHQVHLRISTLNLASFFSQAGRDPHLVTVIALLSPPHFNHESVSRQIPTSVIADYNRSTMQYQRLY